MNFFDYGTMIPIQFANIKYFQNIRKIDRSTISSYVTQLDNKGFHEVVNDLPEEGFDAGNRKCLIRHAVEEYVQYMLQGV